MGFITNRIKSFKHAVDGIVSATKEEWPFVTHWVSTIAVVIAGFYFGISNAEWCAVIICIGLVISLELVNTAIERLCDAVIPEQNPKIKFVKDASAGAVLIAAIAAASIGFIIFFPYVKKMLVG